MKSMILAAGYATRLYPLTEHQPKPLLPVGGRTILDWLLSDLDTLPQISDHVIITNHRFYGHFARWRDRSGYQKPILLLDDGSTDNAGRLGAVRDIRLAAEKSESPEDWLVLAGDNLLDFSLRGFVSFFAQRQSPCIMCYEEPDLQRQRRTGIITLDADGRVTSFAEKPQNPASRLAVPPFYGYRREDIARAGEALLDGCPPDAPGSLAAWLARHTPMYAYPMPGNRIDIGSMESYRAALEGYAGPS